TTTPWTLPANLAVAFNKNFEYVEAVVEKGTQKEETYIVAKKLLDKMVGGNVLPPVISINPQTFSATDLSRLEYEHPFCTRTGRIIATVTRTAGAAKTP